MKKINYIKYLLFVLTLTFIVFISVNTVFTFSPLEPAIIPVTPISGIIPNQESNLKIKKNTIDIEMLKDMVIPTETPIERQAKIKLSYEIQNLNDEDSTINFLLPFLSKFEYLKDEIQVKVDGKTVKTNFNYTNSIYEINFDQREYHEFIEEFNLETLKENLISDYVFQNDIDGFLYTIVGPSFNSNKYRSKSTIHFSNVPNDAYFFDFFGDENSGIMLKSNETEYFFGNYKLESIIKTIEFIKESEGTYSSRGKEITPATITVSPIKLSDYIKQYGSNYNGPYFDAYIKELFINIDKKMSGENYQNYITYHYSNDFLYTYRVMVVDFDATLLSNKTTNIEIEFIIPIYCNTKDDHKSYIIKYYPNLESKYKQVDEVNLNIYTNEQFVDSSHEYIDGDDQYTINVSEFNEKSIMIQMINSEYRRRGCGCGFGFFTDNIIGSLIVGLGVVGLLLRRYKK